jgi:RNA polymerase sigma factor (sigma-70 family)
MSHDDADRKPFDEVYREYADPIFRFCVSQLGSVSLAEEVAAETFAAAFVAYERFRPGADLRPWLYRIARNTANDQHRRARRATMLLARLSRGERAPVSSVEEVVELRDDVRKLVDAAGMLSRRDRELVGLRLAGKMTFREIASVTGMSPTAAQKATERALHRLRGAMEN